MPAGVSLIPFELRSAVHLYWAQDPLSQYSSEEDGESPAGRQLENVEALCSAAGTPVTVSCEFPPSEGELRPHYWLDMYIEVTVQPGASSSPNRASASEDGVTVASVEEDDDLSLASPLFGAGGFSLPVVSVAGTADTQAGEHPYGLSATINMNTKMAVELETAVVEPSGVGELRDVVVDLPAGLVGSAVAAPKCTFAQIQSFSGSCPQDTIVGKLVTEPLALATVNSPVFNMVPKKGALAEFGFNDLLFHSHTVVARVVPTRVTEGGVERTEYVAQAVAQEVPDVRLTSILNTFYGFPAERYNESHRTCVWTGNEASQYQNSTCTEVNGAHEGEYELEADNEALTAMFTMPASCTGEPLKTTVYMDSYEDPARFEGDNAPADLDEAAWQAKTYEAPPVTGCDQLHFEPEQFTFAPEAAHSQADEPSGYESVLKIPQSEKPGTLATPPLKTTIVTLPAGVSVSPSAANGLQGCSEAQIGFMSSEEGHCPAASTIGSVEVATPLLEERLSEGRVFVAEPPCGGEGQPACSEQAAEEGNLFGIYLEVSSRARGLHVKLKGKVEVGGEGDHSEHDGLARLAPGQLRTSFEKTPQLPFNELRFKFQGGPGAPLANPQSCGTFTTDASLEAWSAPQSGPAALENPSFAITGDCGDGFSPAFTAGTTNPQAGAFSSFTTTFSRQDGEQDLSGVTVDMPEGLLGKIAGITQCPEAQANTGSCPASSRVGTATAAVGAGPKPYWQSGPVYLTGPYNGGPFGLSIAVPAVAGPYNLGTIVTRASIRVNPLTAQASIVSDPLPQMVDGVPLRIKEVNVTVGAETPFTFNASSCTEKSIAASISGTGGASANVASRYQAADCATLPFHPVFTASTDGHTSKADGASLHVGIASGGIGVANIAKVDLTIPNILPSRLTTIQKACTEAQFNANPAGCPPESVIATAIVHTPLLNSPLAGPVYFVSHGGAAFPDTEIILQGEGVQLVLDGHTDIKHGVTYSRFESTPDAPFTSFEFNAPEGPYSIFTANGNLCHTEVRMPTKIVAQNGAVLEQDTLVEPEGCPNTLTILSHKVKKRTITIKIAVPGTGKLTATGNGLSKTSKTTTGRSTLTLTLKATGHHKLNTKIKLTYTPTKGPKLTAAITTQIK